MSLTTDVYQLLYEGLRDGWLCLDDLGPDLAGIQGGSPLANRAPSSTTRRRPVGASPCTSSTPPAPWPTTATVYPDPQPLADTGAVVAVRGCCRADGNGEALGPAHAPYFHRVVARHRPGP